MESVGALYVHVPFCARKCAYCDFHSAAASATDPALDEYVRVICAQIRKASELGLLSECATAYIGGGTPTLLGPQRLGTLVRAIKGACAHLAELSCEANPDSLTNDVLAQLVEQGATRVSIGVQSFVDKELAALGRIHTTDQAKERVRAAVASGLDVSVDLMCAIPHQTASSWDKTLREALDTGVGHVSVYPLAIEEGTSLYARYGSMDVPWNSEDVQAERMEHAQDVLHAAGFERYEVASYAQPHKDCKHNQAYWTGVPYLGLGEGAASMLGPQAFDAARGLYGWLPTRNATTDRDAVRMRFSALNQEVEFMSVREAWAEDLMLGMRLTRGIEARLLDAAPHTRDNLIARGLIARRGDRLVPTHDGWLLGNELFGELWALAEE